jgi:integrase
MTKRRGRDEGSIYRRKDGRWVAQYEANGKRRYIYGKTRKDVAQKLIKAIANREMGIVYDSQSLTVARYLDRWLDTVKDGVRTSSFRRYENMVRLHIKPHLGSVRLDKLNTLQLQDLYLDKLDEGLSARTVRYVHVTLNKALKDAVRWELVPRNVAQAAKPPRQHKKEITPLNKEQIKALFKAADGDALYALYVLAVTTGMRQGELLGLKRDDVDLVAGTLQVRRTVYNGKVGAPKTSSGRRTIKLAQLAIRALTEHLEAEKGSEWLFPNGKGTPISCQNLHNRSWKPLLTKAGLPRTTRFHDLRHTSATLLLMQNVNPKIVSEMLGHADVTITLNTYSHVLPSMSNTAAGAMDDALS